MEQKIKRGDIYYAELNPIIGSEQGGERPVIVISNDKGNKYSPTVIVAAITSNTTKNNLPTHYMLDNVDGLPAKSIILFEQIRTIDKNRLKGHITCLDDKILKAIIIPLLISIGIYF